MCILGRAENQDCLKGLIYKLQWTRYFFLHLFLIFPDFSCLGWYFPCWASSWGKTFGMTMIKMRWLFLERKRICIALYKILSTVSPCCTPPPKLHLSFVISKYHQNLLSKHDLPSLKYGFLWRKMLSFLCSMDWNDRGLYSDSKYCQWCCWATGSAVGFHAVTLVESWIALNFKNWSFTNQTWELRV